MKKKFVSLLLAAFLLLSALPLGAAAAELPFTDVPKGAWYEEAVTFVYEKGLFSGTGDTTFSPDAPMTRAMFVTVLANNTSNFNKADYVNKSSFSDVDKNQWYAAGVEWANRANIVSGMGGGIFAPNQNVSREQMALIMYNYAIKTGNDTSIDSGVESNFSDFGSVASWAREAMKWAATHGIIRGENGRINPQNQARRCEVATVITNAQDVLIKTEVEVQPEEPEPDPEPDTELTYSVVLAVNNHLADLIDYGTVTIQDKMKDCYGKMSVYQATGNSADYAAFITSLQEYAYLAKDYRKTAESILAETVNYPELKSFRSKILDFSLDLTYPIQSGINTDSYIHAINSFSAVTTCYTDAINHLSEAVTIFIPIRDRFF